MPDLSMTLSTLDASAGPEFPLPTAAAIIRLFNAQFRESYRTQLVGGAAEPLYRPAGDGQALHCVWFTHDYVASALHEVAHWCIAGEQRRQQEDYGYWYQPDGRDQAQQRAFELVEVKPQAMEWVFATAAGLRFRVSADNLDGGCGVSDDFKHGVWRQARHYASNGLPARAARFARALASEFGGVRYRDPSQYRLESL